MKKAVTFLLILAGLLLITVGCQLGYQESEEQLDAEAVAWLITDPSNVLTQEMADVGSYLFSVDGSTQSSTIESKALGITASYALYFTGNLSSFTWNESTRAYEKELIDVDISLPNREVHLDRLFVQVRFYASTDASGDSLEVDNAGAGLDPVVHSLTYYREVDGTALNLNTGTECDFTAVSDLVFSDIDTDNRAVTINGTHSRDFERLFTNGRMVDASVSYTINNLSIAYDEGTSTFSYSGSIDYIFDATVTRADGTVLTRHQEATVTFDGSTTFIVEVGNLRYRFHLLTGQLVR